jgi:hypothetical protein
MKQYKDGPAVGMIVTSEQMVGVKDDAAGFGIGRRDNIVDYTAP